MKKWLCVIVALGFFSCSNRKFDNPHVEIVTSLGDIEIELFPKKAPKSVSAFLKNIGDGIYAKSSFYRVLKTSDELSVLNTGIVQGGIYLSPGFDPAKRGFIDHEPTSQTGLSNTDGAVSFARSDKGKASTEFFICIGDQSPLDAGRSGTADGQGLAVFGKVVKGMSTVRKIQVQQSNGDRLVEQVDIQKIKVL